jgi:hypothetical protein
LEEEEIATEIDRVKNSIHGVEIERGQLKIDIMNEEKFIEDNSREIKSGTESLNKQKK